MTSRPVVTRSPPARRAHRRRHVADAVARGVAVVHGNPEAFVLHHNSGNGPELVAQRPGGLLEHRDGRGRGVILMMRAVGRGELETVATRIPEAGPANTIGD